MYPWEINYYFIFFTANALLKMFYNINKVIENTIEGLFAVKMLNGYVKKLIKIPLQ